MQFEIKITYHDLKVILTDVAGKSLLLALKVKSTEDLIENVNVLDFDAEKGVVTVCSATAPLKVEEFSYLDIECLEFQSFYKYGSTAAKNFTVE